MPPRDFLLGLYEDPETTDELNEELRRLRLRIAAGLEPPPQSGGFLKDLSATAPFQAAQVAPVPAPAPAPTPTIPQIRVEIPQPALTPPVQPGLNPAQSAISSMATEAESSVVAPPMGGVPVDINSMGSGLQPVGSTPPLSPPPPLTGGVEVDIYNPGRVITPGTATPGPTPSVVPPEPGPTPRIAIDSSSRDAFLRSIAPYAQQVERDTGVSAAIMMGIAANETGSGRFARGNNLFGIKGANPDTGATFNSPTWEVENGRRVETTANFRAYDTPEGSFRDFVRFLHDNSRYRNAVALIGDPTAFIRAIHAAGYATDPDWSSKVLNIASSISPEIMASRGVPASDWNSMTGPVARDPAPARPSPDTPGDRGAVSGTPILGPEADTWGQRLGTAGSILSAVPLTGGVGGALSQAGSLLSRRTPNPASDYRLTEGERFRSPFDFIPSDLAEATSQLLSTDWTKGPVRRVTEAGLTIARMGLGTLNETATGATQLTQMAFGWAASLDPTLKRINQEQGPEAAWNAWKESKGWHAVPMLGGTAENLPSVGLGLASGPLLGVKGAGTGARAARAAGVAATTADAFASGPLAGFAFAGQTKQFAEAAKELVGAGSVGSRVAQKVGGGVDVLPYRPEMRGVLDTLPEDAVGGTGGRRVFGEGSSLDDYGRSYASVDLDATMAGRRKVGGDVAQPGVVSAEEDLINQALGPREGTPGAGLPPAAPPPPRPPAPPTGPLPGDDLPNPFEDAAEKLRQGKMNAGSADAALRRLEKAGEDVEDLRYSLEDFKGLSKDDFDSAMEYREAREEAWDTFLLEMELTEPAERLTPPLASTMMHGRSPAEMQASESAFDLESKVQRILSAPPAGKEAVAGTLTIDEARAVLARLDAAPGDDPAARAAIAARFPELATAVPPVAPVAPVGLTPEAQTLLDSVDRGGIPTIFTNNLKKIAADNGIEITGSMTPMDLLEALRVKGTGTAAGGVPPTIPPERPPAPPTGPDLPEPPEPSVPGPGPGMEPVFKPVTRAPRPESGETEGYVHIPGIGYINGSPDTVDYIAGQVELYQADRVRHTWDQRIDEINRANMAAAGSDAKDLRELFPSVDPDNLAPLVLAYRDRTLQLSEELQRLEAKRVASPKSFSPEDSDRLLDIQLRQLEMSAATYRMASGLGESLNAMKLVLAQKRNADEAMVYRQIPQVVKDLGNGIRTGGDMTDDMEALLRWLKDHPSTGQYEDIPLRGPGLGPGKGPGFGPGEGGEPGLGAGGGPGKGPGPGPGKGEGPGPGAGPGKGPGPGPGKGEGPGPGAGPGKGPGPGPGKGPGKGPGDGGGPRDPTLPTVSKEDGANIRRLTGDKLFRDLATAIREHRALRDDPRRFAAGQDLDAHIAWRDAYNATTVERDRLFAEADKVIRETELAKFKPKEQKAAKPPKAGEEPPRPPDELDVLAQQKRQEMSRAIRKEIVKDKLVDEVWDEFIALQGGGKDGPPTNPYPHRRTEAELRAMVDVAVDAEREFEHKLGRGFSKVELGELFDEVTRQIETAPDLETLFQNLLGKVETTRGPIPESAGPRVARATGDTIDNPAGQAVDLQSGQLNAANLRKLLETSDAPLVSKFLEGPVEWQWNPKTQRADIPVRKTNEQGEVVRGRFERVVAQRIRKEFANPLIQVLEATLKGNPINPEIRAGMLDAIQTTLGMADNPAAFQKFMTKFAGMDEDTALLLAGFEGLGRESEQAAQSLLHSVVMSKAGRFFSKASDIPPDVLAELKRGMLDPDPRVFAKLMADVIASSPSGGTTTRDLYNRARGAYKAERPEHGNLLDVPLQDLWARAHIARVGSMLGMAATQVQNLGGTAFHGLLVMPLARAIAAKDITQYGRELYYAAGAFNMASKEFMATLKTGISPHGIRDVQSLRGTHVFGDLGEEGSFGRNLGRLMDIPLTGPLRLMAAADDLNRTIFEAMVMHTEADRLAKVRSKDGKVVTSTGILLNAYKDPAFVRYIEQQADAGVLRTDYPWMKRLSSLRGNPIVDTLVPFLNTNMNITAQGLSLGPQGLAQLLWRKDLTEMDRAMIYSKAIIGSAVMGLGYMLAGQGTVTGNGPPPGSAEHKALVNAGWAPFSFRIGESYIPLAYLGPLGIPLAIAGVGHDTLKFNKYRGKAPSESTTQYIPADLVVGMGTLFGSATGMRTFLDFTQALNDPQRFGSKFLEGLAASYAPGAGFFGNFTRTFDPTVRDPENPFAAIMAKYPGLASTVPPAIDEWGAVRERAVIFGGLGNAFVPGTVKMQRNDPVRSEVLRLQLKGFNVQPDFVRQDLTPIEDTSDMGGTVRIDRDIWREYQQRAGKIAYPELRMVINSPAWRLMPDMEKAEFIQRTSASARETARELTAAMHPELFTKAAKQIQSTFMQQTEDLRGPRPTPSARPN